MRFLRRDHLSDETIEEILSARRPPEPPTEATAAAHLSAIMDESRRVREHVAQPAPRRRLPALPKRITAGAAASTAFVSLALAGALPGPVQAAASDVLAVVGISVPRGGDEPREADRDQKQQPGEPDAPSSGEPRSLDEDGGQVRQAPATPADRDPERSGADRSGDEPRSSTERDGDEGRGRADDEPRDQGSRDEDADEDDSSGPGSDSDEDRHEDSGETSGGGLADDEEGPEEPDEPEEPESDTEDRSGSGGDSLPDSDDASDALED